MLIERYLAAEILRPVIGIFVFLTAVVLVFYASQLLGRAALEGLPMGIVLRMAGLRLGLFLDVLLPISLLLGTVIGLGRLQAAHEITALAAVGAGRRRVVKALVVTVLAVALIVALASMFFRPWAYTTLYQLERQLAAELNLDRVEPGRFQVGDERWLIYAQGRSDRGLEGVMVRQRADQFSGLIRAERLTQETVEEGVVRLIFEGDVHSYTMAPAGEPDIVARFDRFDILLRLREPPGRERLRRAMPMRRLMDDPTPIEMAELHWRLTGPMTVLVLGLAGLALSRINPRSGQSARVLTATLTGTLYFSGLGVVINWLEQARFPVVPGAFAVPLAVVMILAVRYWLVQRGPGPPL
ncbi:MAG: LPS export ABC transporter permease LptF [Wenzhouxiangella sp.]|jgi:lipopolysaccharide export system permease protein|nr:LPS export ABC transporter permease LptF [Wenzhouxiangella sp.]